MHTSCRCQANLSNWIIDRSEITVGLIQSASVLFSLVLLLCVSAFWIIILACDSVFRPVFMEQNNLALASSNKPRNLVRFLSASVQLVLMYDHTAAFIPGVVMLAAETSPEMSLPPWIPKITREPRGGDETVDPNFSLAVSLFHSCFISSKYTWQLKAYGCYSKWCTLLPGGRQNSE